MNIKLIVIGKTDDKSLQTLIEDYIKRLSFYIKFDLEIISDHCCPIKNIRGLIFLYIHLLYEVLAYLNLYFTTAFRVR